MDCSILGFGGGSGFPSQLPLVTELTPNHGKLGSVIGVFNIFTQKVSSLAGMVIKATSYNSMFHYITFSITIALVILLLARVPKQAEQSTVGLAEVPST